MLRKLLLCFLFCIPLPALAHIYEVGGERPAKLYTPLGYDQKKSYPLVIFLHGVKSSAEASDIWLGLTRVNDRQQFLLLMPNGTKDSRGLRFWNATPLCCDDEHTGVDDIGYIAGLVDEASRRFAVDPHRVYLIGHSNGGFMAYTMACEHPELFRGIISIAGSTFETAAECRNPAPINILQIHGDEDTIVGFNGQGRSPGAFTTVGRWAAIDQCQTRTEVPDALDLVRVKWELGLDEHGIPGLQGDFWDFVTLDFKKETDAFTWSDCLDDHKVGLWKVKGSNHVPSFWGQNVIEKALEFVR